MCINRYAQTLVESTGAWVTFQLSSGIYTLRTPIRIDYPGLTIESLSLPTSTTPTIFDCDSPLLTRSNNPCIMVNSGSFRAINLLIGSGRRISVNGVYFSLNHHTAPTSPVTGDWIGVLGQQIIKHMLMMTLMREH
jgi:hypothetical protein